MPQIKYHIVKINLAIILLLAFNLSAISQSISKSTYGSQCTCVNISVIQADSLISANSLNEDFIIIDVRTSGEYVTGHIENAINIDYYGNDFADNIRELDKEKKYMVYCHSGGRSEGAFNQMNASGFSEVYNMLGGITQWKNQGYPVVTGSFLLDIDVSEEDVLIYPNPAIDLINISFVHKAYSAPVVEILNITGKLMMQKNYSGLIQTMADIDITDMHKGVYFVKVQLDQSVIVKKLVIN